MVELTWQGKYAAPLRLQLAFQTVETVNESAQERQMTQASGRPAIGVTTAVRCKTSPQPRVFHLAAPVGVGEAGRRAAHLYDDYQEM